MKKKPKNPKKKSLSYWKKQADKYFSIYIRRVNADSWGNVICFTCRAIKHWKELQCGHYIPRNHLSTRFSEMNCAVQCVGCNLYGRGKHDEFALHLIDKYGDNILEDLNTQKKKPIKYKIADYQDMIEKYQDYLVGLDIRERG